MLSTVITLKVMYLLFETVLLTNYYLKAFQNAKCNRKVYFSP